MSVTEKIHQYADLDLLESEDRYALAISLKKLVDGVWDFVPKRAASNYIAVFFAFLLWITPQNSEVEQRSKFRLFFNMTVSLVAAATAFTAAGKLEQHQQDLEDETDIRQFTKAAQLDLEKTELDDQAYVAKADTRYRLNSQLPEAHRHPYLISAEEADKARKKPAPKTTADKKAFLQSMGLADHPEAAAFVDDSSTASEHAAGAAKPKIIYRTIRGERKPCILFTPDQKKYCGLSIVDVSRWVARDNYSLLLIGPSGAGKTYLLEHCIKNTQEYKSSVDMFGVTHKGRNIAAGEQLHYAGLEKCKDFLEYSATDDNELRFIENALELRRITGRILKALHYGSTYPTIALIDEINNGHKAVNRLVRIVKSNWEEEKSATPKGQPKPPRPTLLDLAHEYREATSFAFTQGQSKNFRLWVIAHDNTNDALQMPHGEKLSARYLAIARDGQDSAFMRTFADDRFIPDDETRNDLKARYVAFKKAHKKMGSAANVVVCVTNVGGKGWQLCILPQYEPVEAISYGAQNPHVNDIDGDGLPDVLTDSDELAESQPAESEAQPESPAKEPDVPNHPDNESALNERDLLSLEASLIASQPAEQQVRAKALINWLRTEGAMSVRASGAVDPKVIVHRYSAVCSLEELEYLLEVAQEMGIGHFLSEPLTDIRLWQFVEGSPVDCTMPKELKQPAPEKLGRETSQSVDVAEPDAEIDDELPTVEQIFESNCRPSWMDDDDLNYIIDLIRRDLDVIRWRSVWSLWKSTKYYKRVLRKTVNNITKERFILILKVLSDERIGAIQMDSNNEQSYKLLPP